MLSKHVSSYCSKTWPVDPLAFAVIWACLAIVNYEHRVPTAFLQKDVWYADFKMYALCFFFWFWAGKICFSLDGIICTLHAVTRVYSYTKISHKSFDWQAEFEENFCYLYKRDEITWLIIWNIFTLWIVFSLESRFMDSLLSLQSFCFQGSEHLGGAVLFH
jgi:hypothetical protein